MAEAELRKKSIQDLRYIAKMLGIKSLTTYKKDELIQKIMESENFDAEKAAEETPVPVKKKASKKAEKETEIPAEKRPGRGRRKKSENTEPAEAEKTESSESVKKEPEPDVSEESQPAQSTPSPEEIKETDNSSNTVQAKEPAPDNSQNNRRNRFPDDNEIEGILEIVSDSYGFLRVDGYVASNKDIYVPAVQIRRFNLKTGDKVRGKCRFQKDTEKYQALYFVTGVNDGPSDSGRRRKPFDSLTPIYPDEKLKLELDPKEFATRLIDLMAPIGKGQRGIIVSPPKAGKTVLLKKIANSIATNYPDIHLMVLLIDERPEEVTDMRESVRGEVISPPLTRCRNDMFGWLRWYWNELKDWWKWEKTL